MPLMSTSAFGMTYEARPLKDVWNGDSWWQYGFVMNCVASGTAVRIAHQSLTTLPVLVPPEKVKFFTDRTVKFTSTPLNTRVSSPTSFVDLISRRSEEHTSELQSRFGISYA